MKKFKCRNTTFLSEKKYLMGILNVTPDSFSDGGDFFDEKKSINRFNQLIDENVDIIDIGAFSTRPGREIIDVNTEIDRLKMIFECVDIGNTIISVDTFNLRAAEYALEHGASIINDVSGQFNFEMCSLVKQFGAGWIITHTLNNNAGIDGDYKSGVTADVLNFFDHILNKIEKIGLDKNQICLDAGFGFSKSVDDNIQLLRDMKKIIPNDTFFLSALSRKRFVGALCSENEPKKRDEMSHYLELYTLNEGADIFRTHECKNARKMVDALNIILGGK